jgi:release factor glutamine methyltransferase
MTLFQKKTQFSLLLQNIYPKNEAESITGIVFQELLKLSSTEIKTKKDLVLDDELNAQLDSILSRLYKKEPVQYILGITYFYNLKFAVNQGVLIPRRETEELVDLIIKQNNKKQPKILDIGTGSGCIAVTLKKNIPQASVFAIDKSENAVNTAKQNALSNLKIDKKDKFLVRDIFDESWWSTLTQFDIIASNPPYVTEDEKSLMHANVLDYEPAEALFVSNENPLTYYKTIADFALKSLNNKGLLYFEINEAFGNEVKNLLTDKGYSNATIYKDMQGKDRIVSATKA